MPLAVVFPGQGSQKTGMGRDWYDAYDVARDVYRVADDALGFPISRLCFEGPDETLRLTENQQPAILTASYAAYSCIEDRLPVAACYAGHSLGEHTALVASCALPFDQAVRIVRRRGQLMQDAVPPGQGAMAAVVGLDVEKIREINAQASAHGAIDIANLNSPVQVVVSGSTAAVAFAKPLYSEAGARRVVDLPVSAPFHSSLMVQAADGLLPELRAAGFACPSVPVIANLTVQPYPAETVEYPKLLHGQIYNAVRWLETVQYLEAQGMTHVLEVGPGMVLRQLVAKTTRNLQVNNLETVADLEQVLDWAGGVEA